jgi:hypothetical protein
LDEFVHTFDDSAVIARLDGASNSGPEEDDARSRFWERLLSEQFRRSAFSDVFRIVRSELESV